MANEQTNTNEAIVQAVATRAVIQAMVVAAAERTQNAEPRLGRPLTEQPTFDGTMNSNTSD